MAPGGFPKIFYKNQNEHRSGPERTRTGGSFWSRSGADQNEVDQNGRSGGARSGPKWTRTAVLVPVLVHLGVRSGDISSMSQTLLWCNSSSKGLYCLSLAAQMCTCIAGLRTHRCVLIWGGLGEGRTPPPHPMVASGKMDFGSGA